AHLTESKLSQMSTAALQLYLLLHRRRAHLTQLRFGQLEFSDKRRRSARGCGGGAAAAVAGGHCKLGRAGDGLFRRAGRGRIVEYIDFGKLATVDQSS